MSSNIKVLLADDDLIFLNYIREDLTAQGIDVITARYAKEAIKLFNSTNGIDLAILDLHLPYDIQNKEEILFKNPHKKRAAGLEISEHVFRDIPVIFLTGADEDEMEKLLTKRSVDAVVNKDAKSIDGIQRVIKRTLSARVHLKETINPDEKKLQRVVGIMQHSYQLHSKEILRECVLNCAKREGKPLSHWLDEVIVGYELWGDLVFTIKSRIDRGIINEFQKFQTRSDPQKRNGRPFAKVEAAR